MKKLLYIGAMSALLLSACSSHDEAPASEQAEAKEKTVNAETKETLERKALNQTD
ncbi:hypothetical protein [Lysinibacillus pakistanensis]|uniref:Uncharacterized protein n=1 Tax=Lysinibacillus pakistanensis TaxID=759811 RepID=A0AAX3X588_9BACI|nr:hypothetical protein [Lysinibacillus pakistanensis]MDM5233578.1 hypothetical protein [Lysinibacillus pakistanensis]WHY49044.1 hypothetical protein QNH22_12720 [Lysinibacillus pakistanensis]WHY54056.1 hypothetical protein QNH24_12700 [Lysinibacillus pakistanensis]